MAVETPIEILPDPPTNPCPCPGGENRAPCLEPPGEDRVCPYCARYHTGVPLPAMADLADPEDGPDGDPWWSWWRR